MPRHRQTVFPCFFSFLVIWCRCQCGDYTAPDDELLWGSRCNENWRDKKQYSEKTCPSATLCTVCYYRSHESDQNVSTQYNLAYRKLQTLSYFSRLGWKLCSTKWTIAWLRHAGARSRGDSHQQKPHSRSNFFRESGETLLMQVLQTWHQYHSRLLSISLGACVSLTYTQPIFTILRLQYVWTECKERNICNMRYRIRWNILRAM